MRQLINIGVDAVNKSDLNRRIRFSNLILAITSIYMLLFLPAAVIYQYYEIATLNFIYLIIALSGFYLHTKKKHVLVFHSYCIYGVIYSTLGTVIYGLQSQLHLLLLVITLIAIVLLDNPSAIKLFCITVSFTFVTLVIYMQNREGIIQFNEKMKETQNILEVAMLFACAFITLVFFLFFKNENVDFQKKLLEQKKIAQEKQTDVLDSINYAKRIQDSFLPSLKTWHQIFPESFILYLPKDIVAGDFYWLEKEPQGKQIFFAVGDCTGHGVPGALVSVVCHNALNRSVLEFKLNDPGEILDKTRELVIEAFKDSEDTLFDGMDISLCAINPETLEFYWSGANNSLCYIEQSDNKKIKEIKANKQPVGNYSNIKPFTTHQLKLNKGDYLYLYTDGYADQFGGIKGKKLMYKAFKEKLLQIHTQSAQEQRFLLLEHFTAWKKDLSQVDDVCILGIKI